MENNDKREKLKEFYYSIRNCQKCELSRTRTNFVFGSGNANSRIMFVGEAPGKNEDLQGKPFVGQAGKLLDELLNLIGFSRNEVFIANVLKCRPPQNRDPKLEEINLCKNYLFEQIKIIQPLIICTLGKYSTQLLLNTEEGITGLRGRVFKIDDEYVLPINHPAAALYTPSRFEILKIDFIRVAKVIKMLETGKADSSIIIEDNYGFQKPENPAFSEIDMNITVQNTGAKKEEIKSIDSKENVSNENKSSPAEQMGLF